MSSHLSELSLGETKKERRRRQTISEVLLDLCYEDYVPDFKLTQELEDELGESVEIEKQRNGAWEVHFRDGTVAYVGIRASFVEDTSKELVKAFTKIIRKAPSLARKSAGVSSSAAGSGMTEEPTLGGKLRVKGRFKCKCRRKWTSYMAFIDSRTKLPWQGKTQRCAGCSKRAVMKSFEYLEEKEQESGGRKPHRAELCEWCGNWQLEGEHSRMAFFVQPSTLSTALGEEYGISATQKLYNDCVDMSIVCHFGDEEEVTCVIEFTPFVNFGE